MKVFPAVAPVFFFAVGQNLAAILHVTKNPSKKTQLFLGILAQLSRFGRQKKLASTKLTWLAGKWTRIEDGFPIENGNFPASYVSLPDGILKDIQAFWLLIYKAEHWPFHWLEYVCEPTNIHMATMVESSTINPPPKKKNTFPRSKQTQNNKLLPHNNSYINITTFNNS